jgi:phosphoribosylglycinamide formyltransferase-1
MYRFGWFSTGITRAARELLTAAYGSISRGDIEGELAFVFCTREPGESTESDLFMELVAEYKIPLICFSYRKHKAGQSTPDADEEGNLAAWRLDYDREVMNRLRDFNPDLCVLAGYMLITGPELCQKYDMINLHPAAPGGPVGTWQQVIWQLIAEDARETGVLMNLVTPELDKGPVVTYCTFSIRSEPFDRYWKEIEGLSVEEIKKRQGTDNPLFKLIREHGVARELPLITATMKVFSRGGVKIVDGQITDSAGRPIKGYNLTDEIDELMKGVH